MMGRESLAGIATRYKNLIPMGARFSAPLRAGSETDSPSYAMGTTSFPGGGGGVKWPGGGGGAPTPSHRGGKEKKRG